MVRNHSQHRDAGDERARLAKLKKHEDAVRENERRHIAAALAQQPGEYRDCYGQPVPNEDIAVDGLW